MTYRLAFVLAGFAIASTFVSCSKQDAIPVVETNSFNQFRSWMTVNVQQQAWTDPNYFYWKVNEVKLNGVQVNSNGIGYMKTPAPNVYPTLEQTNGSYLRTIEIGNPSPVHCAYYSEVMSSATLIIKTTTGKQYRWNNCPIKVSEHETNPAELDWKVKLPNIIEVVCTDLNGSK